MTALTGSGGLSLGLLGREGIDDTTVPVFRPYLGPEVRDAVTSALDAGWLGMGRLTADFEQEVAAFLELEHRHVVATSSCTDALRLAALVAGVGVGDEVICPSFTYVAGHQAIGATGARVVFCDVEEDTLGVSVESVRSMISPRTKGVLAVHFAGIPCDVSGLHALAREHGLRVIEDAAHAFGSRADGRRIGSFGDLACFSFGPVKLVTTLEGGAVVTPHKQDVQTLHELRMIGVDSDTHERYKNSRTWQYDVVRQGYRNHLGSVPAAIGLAQLTLAEEFIANRQSYCRTYSERLSAIPELILPLSDFRDVSPFIYVIRVSDEHTRGMLMAHMARQGVATGIHFLGAHEFSFYRGHRRSDLTATERASRQVVTIPLHSYMSEQVLDRVVDSIASFFGAG